MRKSFQWLPTFLTVKPKSWPRPTDFWPHTTSLISHLISFPNLFCFRHNGLIFFYDHAKQVPIFRALHVLFPQSEGVLAHTPWLILSLPLDLCSVLQKETSLIINLWKNVCTPLFPSLSLLLHILALFTIALTTVGHMYIPCFFH